VVRPDGDDAIRVEEYGDRSAPPCCTGTLTRTAPKALPSQLPLAGAIDGLGTPVSVTWLGGWATQYPATTAGSLWLPLDGSGEVARVDTRTGAVLARIPVGDPSRGELHSDPHAAAATDDGVWVTNADDRSLVLIDPATDAEVRRIALDVTPYALAIDGRRAWVASFEDSTVILVDLAAGKRLAAADVASPTGIAVAPGGDVVWVVEHRADRVLRLRGDTLEVDGTVGYGGPGPNPVCGYCIENVIYAEDAAWTADNHRRTVTRLDPHTDEATTFTLPLDVWAVTAGGGRIWASQYDPGAATATWMTASIEPATGSVETYPLPAQSVAWADDILWAAEPARRSDVLTGVAVEP
jgi:DNA-binding beta-propeller fold protein YncE